MRKLVIFAILAALCSVVSAQRVFRSEYTLYDTREDALTSDHSQTANHLVYAPQTLGTLGEMEMVGMDIEVPASWNDFNAYLHLENIRSGYDVAINGAVAFSSEDGFTPADYFKIGRAHV